jgi:hypothetical protein
MKARYRSVGAFIAASLVTFGLECSAQQVPPIKPSSPAEIGRPVWTRAVKMPDGRTFVTDGGLMVDAVVAKPSVMPDVVLPVANGEILARNFSASFDKEVGLGDLRPGSLKNTFVTPDGIALNGNYVRFLGSILSVGRTRLRTRGPSDPVTVFSGEQPVAIVMPVATLR